MAVISMRWQLRFLFDELAQFIGMCFHFGAGLGCSGRLFVQKIQKFLERHQFFVVTTSGRIKEAFFFWQLEIKSSLKNLAHISRQCGRNLALNFTQQLNNRRWMQAWTFPRPRCSIPVQISILYRQRLMPGSRPFLDSPRSGTQD